MDELSQLKSRIDELQQKVEKFETTYIELVEFMEQKKLQQLSYPLDEVSKTIINEL